MDKLLPVDPAIDKEYENVAIETYNAYIRCDFEKLKYIRDVTLFTSDNKGLLFAYYCINGGGIHEASDIFTSVYQFDIYLFLYSKLAAIRQYPFSLSEDYAYRIYWINNHIATLSKISSILTDFVCCNKIKKFDLIHYDTPYCKLVNMTIKRAYNKKVKNIDIILYLYEIYLMQYSKYEIVCNKCNKKYTKPVLCCTQLPQLLTGVNADYANIFCMYAEYYIRSLSSLPEIFKYKLIDDILVKFNELPDLRGIVAVMLYNHEKCYNLSIGLFMYVFITNPVQDRLIKYLCANFIQYCSLWNELGLVPDNIISMHKCTLNPKVVEQMRKEIDPELSAFMAPQLKTLVNTILTTSEVDIIKVNPGEHITCEICGNIYITNTELPVWRKCGHPIGHPICYKLGLECNTCLADIFK
jgi:hypothetical protein